MYAEGRVEHQKRTQTATTLWPCGFVLVFNSIHQEKSDPPTAENRVEYQKLNQRTVLLFFGRVFGAQLDSLENKCPF